MDLLELQVQVLTSLADRRADANDVTRARLSSRDPVAVWVPLEDDPVDRRPLTRAGLCHGANPTPR